jgi:hypothetical protein
MGPDTTAGQLPHHTRFSILTKHAQKSAPFSRRAFDVIAHLQVRVTSRDRVVGQYGSNLLLGLLILKFFSIIAEIWALYLKNFGIMARGKRRPEERFR